MVAVVVADIVAAVAAIAAAPVAAVPVAVQVAQDAVVPVAAAQAVDVISRAMHQNLTRVSLKLRAWRRSSRAVDVSRFAR
jgi:hypothetical protein